MLFTAGVIPQHLRTSLSPALRVISTMSQQRYRPSRLSDIENLELYRPGGFHPIAIGNTFVDGRYRILHKLGFGGSSTVWLARDHWQRAQSSIGALVTLKVLSAEKSSKPKDELPELVVPIELDKLVSQSGVTNVHSGTMQTINNYFMHEGPNGNHLCLVYPFAGPSIYSMSECPGRVSGSRRLRADLARKAANQTASVIELMHSAGIVHGDLTTYNILFQASDHISQWSDNEIYATLGTPETEEIVTRDRSVPGPCAPRELVAPIDNSRLCSPHLLQEEIVVIDFGQSFFTKHRPKHYEPATVVHYLSPETRFEQTISPASDIWALACAIFEIRAGAPLFDPFLGDPIVMKDIIETLGKLPDPWWDAFEHRQTWFEHDGEPKSLEIQKQEGILLPAVKNSVLQKLRGIGSQDNSPPTDERRMIEKAGTKLGEEELALLCDLLEKMLKYQPEERITIQEVVGHPWFGYGSR